jgi:hypothetical protein
MEEQMLTILSGTGWTHVASVDICYITMPSSQHIFCVQTITKGIHLS